MRIVLGALFFTIAATSSGVAADAPAFLKGKKYATDAASCGKAHEIDGLQLSKEGIYGPEFSCQFVDFKIDADPNSDRIYSAVAIANCSDDTGISRADLVTLSPYVEAGQVFVQSQNEYVISDVEILIAQKLGKDIPEKSEYAWVSNTYNLCK
ncbi:MAG: hypothetical protein AAF478_08820 [Pseudomonadota bacterium]